MNHKYSSKANFRRVILAVTAISLGCVAVSAVNEKGAEQSRIAVPADPIKTDAGYITGTIIGEAGKEVRIYRGIPYAAPPVGGLRWKPPQAVTPWQGIRECARFGPYATQYTWTEGQWMTEIQESQMSEDCLHLNVLAPARKSKSALPVMVWLHDGGLDAGSGNRSVYNNPDLPQHGVVLVTVSHRIGGMGFFAHPGLSAESPNHASGNYGMMDIVAALNWVKQNIASFGGDPHRVTIFGQSGGGTKVMWLLTSPLSKGLFQRAVMEGGVSSADGATGFRRDVQTKEEAEMQGAKIAAKLASKNIADLRAKSWQEFLKALPPPRTPPADELKMRFTVDGWSMPDRPFNIASKGMGHAVPVMIGGGEAETAVHQGTALYAPGLLKANSSLFVYIFSHVPTNWKNAGLKAYHGLELFYQFGGLEATAGRKAAVSLAPSNYPPDAGFDKSDEIIADYTMKMWAQFAQTGNPSVNGLVKWPTFKMTPGEDKYMNIALPLQVNAGFFKRFKR
jgi:para-nitrobenzyl esterase